ncbi:MAG: acyl-CoA thioesterase [Planctomycetota bacterium]|nr:acyl-CoA thioesterase [Planctomycetota bacterium]
METTAHITRLVLPGLTNRHGSLFGGVALSLMDEAAGIVSTRVSRGPCVTAHIQSVDFEEPIWEGEAISVHAALIGVGRTSMRIKVETWAECLEEGTRRRSTAAEFVMVAIDKVGKPRPVPAEAQERLDAQADGNAQGEAEG